MLTLFAFLITLALLIVVHEYGHYRMARACGVKVLRFSIGFGKSIWRWQSPNSGTEFVLSAIPLGGYVKMLDEREEQVPPNERHLAFNTQPLRSRVAIVAAGPLANLLLACILYALVNWLGAQTPAPLLAKPEAGSLAQAVGIQGGERVVRAALDEDVLQEVASFDDLRWLLAQGVLSGQRLQLEVIPATGQGQQVFTLQLAQLQATTVDTTTLQKIGLVAPFTRPLIGQVMPAGAAEKAGLRTGDLVQQVGLVKVVDGQQLRKIIRASVLAGESSSIWKVNRAGVELELPVKPEAVEEDGVLVGKIGAYVGDLPEMVLVQYGLLDGLWLGVQRTWNTSMLTLSMTWRMLTGEASLKNLSGPLSIADYAGKSADLGLISFLQFLALISVSLGVFNLLPLPVLDGGHLMYYLWEYITGSPVSDAWMNSLQRWGIAILLFMMVISLFNDVTRLFG